MSNEQELQYVRFALFSLDFTTANALSDDKNAKSFFDDLQKSVASEYLPHPYDTDKLVTYARLGEKGLEKLLSNLQHNDA
jgi:hypothetical protein